MKLNAFERVTLLGILPEQGNFATLKIVNELRLKLSFTEEEYKEFEIKTEGTSIKWNSKGTEGKEISIGEKATDIIVEALKQLDEKEELTINQYTLYEKFIN